MKYVLRIVSTILMLFTIILIVFTIKNALAQENNEKDQVEIKKLISVLDMRTSGLYKVKDNDSNKIIYILKTDNDIQMEIAHEK